MKNLKVRNKFLILIIIPLILILVLSYSRLKNSHKEFEIGKETFQFSKILILDSELIHELQKERGLTAGFLASKKEKGFSEVIEQRKQSDLKIENLKIFFIEFKTDINSNFISIHQKIFQELNIFRQVLEKENILVAEEILFYTDRISVLISQMHNIKSKTEDYKILSMFEIYYKLAQLKEFSGIERATINSALNKNELDDLIYDKWLSLIANQNFLLKEINLDSSTEVKKDFDKNFSEDLIKEFEEKRNLVKKFKESKSKTIESNDWWQVTTKRINQLKKIETEVSKIIQNLSENQMNQSRNQLIFDFILICLTIVVLSILTIKIINDIIKNIQDFIAKNERVTNGILVLEASKPRKDEFGILNHSIEKMVSGLREMINNIASISESLSSSSSQVFSTANHSAGIASELASAINEAESAIENMNGIFNQILILTDDSKRDLKKLDTNKQILNDSMLIISLKSNLVSKKMLKAEQNVIKGKEEITILDNAMNEIKQRAKELNSSLNVINEISDQVNLLSLNASIEAARSGEFGLGFAVVAKNISSLANSTEENVKKISSLMKQSEQAISMGLNSSKNVSENFSEINTFILESKTTFKETDTQIQKQLIETNDFVDHLDDFVRISNQIKDLTIQFKSSVETIRDTFYINSDQAQLSASNAEELAAVSSVIKSYSENLKTSVSKFRMEN